MITVCLPDSAAVESVGELPDVRFVVWDGLSEPPSELSDVQFLVGKYASAPPQRSVLAGMPRLAVVQLLSAGVESWLDRIPPGAVLCNGRGVHGASTAELAVAGLVSVVRDLPHLLDAQREHRWAHGSTGSLAGSSVLVLGAGDIGRRIGTALTAFGADAVLVGRTARDDIRELADVPALLPAQDAVVVALPATPETTRLVDATFLAAMRDGAVVVNVARGAVVDTDALVAELTTGRLRAFLDVTEPEPLPVGHPLWDAPGLVLTPHIGGGTHGWERRAYELVREQIGRFQNGEQLHNVVSQGF
ncbi:MAG TPA: 2-hydroxyacid dehydrogenase [Jatrophihabitantaceae bacterium]|nr:2-hydroxyacid dehydrogenase [Jatrophihabitantaceae bacterium]